MSSHDLIRTFVAESHELLEAMESRLLQVKDGEPDVEAPNEIFRAAHTIKGSSGQLGLAGIVELAARVEESARAADFDAARAGLAPLRASVKRFCESTKREACHENGSGRG